MTERLSRGDLLQVIELSRRCLAVDSYEGLRVVLDELAALTAVDRVAIAAVGPGTEGRIDHHVDHSYGAAWVGLYAAGGLCRLDHVLRHARLARGALRWRDAPSTSASPLFLEAARDHGLFDGITYALPSPASSPWIMLPVGLPRGRDPERGIAIVSSLAPHLHEAYARLRERDRRPQAAGVTLSAREREILSWIQDGKTSWEIGLILGISERTVKFHCGRLQAKLGAVSRSHAVAKAMRLGLLG